MDKEVAKLFAKHFIARPDVHAQQRANGDWFPVESPISMPLLLSHLSGGWSLGHYLLNRDNQVKFLAFDIDLEKANPERNIWWPMPRDYNEDAGEWIDFRDGNPRGAWETLQHAPDWLKKFLTYQLLSCATRIMRSAQDLFPQFPVVPAYSGHKGLHIYVLTGLIQASDAREAAQIILDHTGVFQLSRGNNFYKGIPRLDQNIDPWPQLSVEIFPKQSAVDNKGYGNLMRLPLGRHLVASPDHPYPRAFFLDARRRYTELAERDPIEALTATDPWAGVPPRE